MPNKNKSIPTAMRITPEVSEKFREIAQDLGTNQDQTLAKLIEVYEVELGRAAIPGARENIDMFEGYTRAIINMYMQALESNQNMRAVVRTEYESQLKTKDSLIEELHARTNAAESQLNGIKAKEEEYQGTIDTLSEKIKELTVLCEKQKQEYESILFSTREKYEVLESSYTKLQASDQETKEVLSDFIEENKRLKEENNIYHDKNRELDVQIFALGRENEILSSNLEESKNALAEAISECKKTIEKERKSMELEHRLALTEQKNSIEEEHKAEIDELRRELDKYRDMYYQSIK